VVAPETRTIVLEVLFNYTLTILHLLELDFRVWIFRSGATYRFAQASPPWVEEQVSQLARTDLQSFKAVEAVQWSWGILCVFRSEKCYKRKREWERTAKTK